MTAQQIVLDEVFKQRRLGKTPKQIADAIEELVAARKLPHGRSISQIKRDIDRLHNEVSTEAETWTFLDDQTGFPEIVLETHATVIEQTEAGISSFAIDEARLIVRVGRHFPDLPAADRWNIASLYLARSRTARTVDDLDMLLAFAPWRGVAECTRYVAAVERGLIQLAPLSFMTERFCRFLEDVAAKLDVPIELLLDPAAFTIEPSHEILIESADLIIDADADG